MPVKRQRKLPFGRTVTQRAVSHLADDSSATGSRNSTLAPSTTALLVPLVASTPTPTPRPRIIPPTLKEKPRYS